MRFDALQNPGLAFLLTLAAVPMAGCDFAEPEPDDAESGGSTSDDPSNATTSSSASTDATASSTDAADSTGADPTGGGTQLCKTYAAHIVVCYPQQGPNQSKFVEYCTTSLEYYASISPACLAAAEDLFACIVALDCDVLVDDGTCPVETAALEACG